MLLKSLEKATEDYEKAKAKAENLQKRAAEAIRRMKACEAAKIEAENMEIIHIVRETGWNRASEENTDESILETVASQKFFGDTKLGAV